MVNKSLNKRQYSDVNQEKQSTQLTIGNLVWYYAQNLNEFVLAKIINITGNLAKIQLKTNSHIVEIDVAQLYEVDIQLLKPNNIGVADCVHLNYLTYPNVLENLRVRFLYNSQDQNKVFCNNYTYAGPILLAVNSYVIDHKLYSNDICDMYFEIPLGEADPHPFAIASEAFETFLSTKKSQYILVSGESGSGKTECTKFVLKYLTWVSNRKRKKYNLGVHDDAEQLAKLLLKSNPILEFFGNAKTLRNNNSSRFGKLFTVYYTQNGDKLLNADINTYLLAKSRVVDCPKNEQNYHIFYSIINAPRAFQLKYITDTTINSPYLGNVNNKNYANPNFMFYITNLLDAFHTFNFSDETIDDIFRIVYGILYMSQVEFINIDTSEGVCVVDDVPLFKAAKLWGLESNIEELIKSLTTVNIHDVVKYFKADEAYAMAASVCKGLYEALFNYIVSCIQRCLKNYTATYNNNANISRDSINGYSNGSMTPINSDRTCLGVLDLFGFENLLNGLEQLCINYANEQLQNHFIKQVMYNEINLYIEENIVNEDDINIPVYNNLNNDIIELFIGSKYNIGIFKILEDCCQLYKNDKQFCLSVNNEIYKNMARRNNNFNNYLACTRNSSITTDSNHKKRKKFDKLNENFSTEVFTIYHYAEPVTYVAEGFIKRNTDYISNDFKVLLTKSKLSLVKNLFLFERTNEKKKTVCSTFQKEMMALINNLNLVTSYHIKCIKPNNDQATNYFNKSEVIRQLITNGIGPVLEVMKLGYPCRIEYKQIYSLFTNILNNSYKNVFSPIKFTEILINYLRLPYSNLKFGKTKLFMKYGTFDFIEGEIKKIQSSPEVNELHLSIMQSYYRQSFVRVCKFSLASLKFIMLAKRLQARRIAYNCLNYYTNVYLPTKRNKAARTIQSWYTKVHLKKLELKRKLKAIIYIQKNIRAYFGRKCYAKLLENKKVNHGHSDKNSENSAVTYIQDNNSYIDFINNKIDYAIEQEKLNKKIMLKLDKLRELRQSVPSKLPEVIQMQKHHRRNAQSLTSLEYNSIDERDNIVKNENRDGTTYENDTASRSFLKNFRSALRRATNFNQSVEPENQIDASMTSYTTMYNDTLIHEHNAIHVRTPINKRTANEEIKKKNLRSLYKYQPNYNSNENTNNHIYVNETKLSPANKKIILTKIKDYISNSKMNEIEYKNSINEANISERKNYTHSNNESNSSENIRSEIRELVKELIGDPKNITFRDIIKYKTSATHSAKSNYNFFNSRNSSPKSFDRPTHYLRNAMNINKQQGKYYAVNNENESLNNNTNIDRNMKTKTAGRLSLVDRTSIMGDEVNNNDINWVLDVPHIELPTPVMSLNKSKNEINNKNELDNSTQKNTTPNRLLNSSSHMNKYCSTCSIKQPRISLKAWLNTDNANSKSGSSNSETPLFGVETKIDHKNSEVDNYIEKKYEFERITSNNINIMMPQNNENLKNLAKTSTECITSDAATYKSILAKPPTNQLYKKLNANLDSDGILRLQSLID